MKVWLVGGGTAGHVLPLLALAHNLKARKITPVFIVDRSKSNKSLTSKQNNVSRLHTGKFRRYHGRTWAQRLIDIGTLLHNIKDVFLVIFGFIEAIWLLLIKRPKVIFINGGAISVPVAWAAVILRVPYLIHESDVIAGLANKLIAKRAELILTGFPTEHFNARKSTVTGIPLRGELTEAKRADRFVLKRRYGFDPSRPLVLITGGSQGAKTINQAIANLSEPLSKLADVVHITGPSHLETVVSQTHQPERGYRVVGFADAISMANFLGMADLVISRAGSTTLAELAFMAKPTIVIPNPMLAAGHQLANAALLAGEGAIVQISEETVKQTPDVLLNTISELMKSSVKRQQLAQNIAKFSRPNAVADIVDYILAIGRGERVQDA